MLFNLIKIEKRVSKFPAGCVNFSLTAFFLTLFVYQSNLGLPEYHTPNATPFYSAILGNTQERL